MSNRTFIILTFMFFIFFNPVNGQTWQVLYNHKDGGLRDVFFIDSLHGWLIGDNGKVLRTTNGGYSWIQNNIGEDIDLRAVFFSSTLRGWAVGREGNIFYTSNGGTTWIAQESGTSFMLYDIYFQDDNIGWTVGVSGISEGVVFYTENGGENWITLSEELSGGFLGIHFINNNEGWVAGGQSFFDNFDQEVIWHTTNSGNSWERQNSPATTGPLHRIFMFNSKVGWAVGMNQVVINTTDGGLNWKPINVKEGPIVANKDFTDVAMTDRNNIWVVDLDKIYHSFDGGLNWSNEWFWQENTLKYYPRLSMVDSVHGWAVADSVVIGYFDYFTSILGKNDYGLSNLVSLEQNYPNPFNPTTTIEFSIPQNGTVMLTVYNVLGRQVETILNKHMTAGHHKLHWNARNIPSGIYFIRMQSGDFRQVRKVMVVR